MDILAIWGLIKKKVVPEQKIHFYDKDGNVVIHSRNAPRVIRKPKEK